MSYSVQEAFQASMNERYKELKQDFVSGLSGGEIPEINYVTAVAPAAVVLFSVLQSRQSFFKPYGVIPFLVDFLLNVGAILLAVTLYSNSPIILNLLILAPIPIIYSLPKYVPTKKTKTKVKVPPQAKQNQKVAVAEVGNELPKKPFLTTYRGSMMVITCIAILAVDFKIFPRRFAKVETWGTSLMDVGVGSFVFSAGVVGARPVLKEKLAGKTAWLHVRLLRSLRHSAPLLIMGLIRLYSVKGLDYAEHVTEYGVHWNFFFTLGFLPPFVAIFQSLFQYLPSYAGLSILLGGGYQLALKHTSLDAYILTAPRTDLLSQNREGVFSFIGYLAIFLAGQSTGMFLLPRRFSSTLTPTESRKILLLMLTAWSFIWIVLFAFTYNLHYGLNLQVSRRMANLPYFLWIAAFNTTQITVFCLIETVFFPKVYQSTNTTPKEDAEIYKASTSRILEAFNRNGLPIFLVANLLTGAVNLTVKTLYVRGEAAMGFLLVYMGILTLLAVGLDAKGITIKL